MVYVSTRFEYSKRKTFLKTFSFDAQCAVFIECQLSIFNLQYFPTGKLCVCKRCVACSIR